MDDRSTVKQYDNKLTIFLSTDYANQHIWISPCKKKKILFEQMDARDEKEISCKTISSCTYKKGKFLLTSAYNGLATLEIFIFDPVEISVVGRAASKRNQEIS